MKPCLKVILAAALFASLCSCGLNLPAIVDDDVGLPPVSGPVADAGDAATGGGVVEDCREACFTLYYTLLRCQMISASQTNAQAFCLDYAARLKAYVQSEGLTPQQAGQRCLQYAGAIEQMTCAAFRDYLKKQQQK